MFATAADIQTNVTGEHGTGAMTSILIYAGSARRGAFSRQLAAAATTIVGESGGKATLVDLTDFDVPLYNADIEDGSGIPHPVVEFRRLVATHQGMIIATPGYNGFVTPLLLNMLFWASRPSPADDFGAVFQNKPVALLASSPGRLGGVRVIPRLRDVVAELGMVPVPGFTTVPQAGEAFTPRGRLADASLESGLTTLIDRLLLASHQQA